MRHLLAVCAFASAACAARIEPVLTLTDEDQVTGDDDAATDELAADADTPNPSLCTIAGLALCDGFEQPQVQSPPWFFVNIAASVTIDTQRFYRGTRSLHVRTEVEPDPVQPTRQGELTQTDAVPLDTLYGRVFMYVASPLPTWSFRILGLLQPNSPNLGPMLFVDGGKLEVYPQSSTSLTSQTDLPLDRWFCLELKVVNAVAGEVQIWLDGVEVTDLHYNGDTTMNPPVGRFSIGTALFGDSAVRPAFDVWFDELGLDDQRIGCSR